MNANELKNQVQLIGNIANEIEFKELPNDKFRASLTLVTHEKYPDKNTGEEITVKDFHSVVLWNNTALYASKNLKKGSFIILVGKLRSNRKHVTPDQTYYNTFIEGLSILKLKKDKD